MNAQEIYELLKDVRESELISLYVGRDYMWDACQVLIRARTEYNKSALNCDMSGNHYKKMAECINLIGRELVRHASIPKKGLAIFAGYVPKDVADKIPKWRFCGEDESGKCLVVIPVKLPVTTKRKQSYKCDSRFDVSGLKSEVHDYEYANRNLVCSGDGIVANDKYVKGSRSDSVSILVRYEVPKDTFVDCIRKNKRIDLGYMADLDIRMPE